MLIPLFLFCFSNVQIGTAILQGVSGECYDDGSLVMYPEMVLFLFEFCIERWLGLDLLFIHLLSVAERTLYSPVICIFDPKRHVNMNKHIKNPWDGNSRRLGLESQSLASFI